MPAKINFSNALFLHFGFGCFALVVFCFLNMIGFNPISGLWRRAMVKTFKLSANDVLYP